MIKEINSENEFQTEVLDSDIPVLVDFWAPWCPPCRMVAPHVDAVSSKYEGKLKVVKVNVDENIDVASNYGVVSIPTFMVFKLGKKVDEFVGALPQSAIEEKVKKHII